MFSVHIMVSMIFSMRTASIQSAMYPTISLIVVATELTQTETSNPSVSKLTTLSMTWCSFIVVHV